MESILEKAADVLLDQGLSGIAIIGLVYLVFLLRAELKDERAARRLEVAERDKLVSQVQEARVVEARAGYEIIRSISSTQDAVLQALRKGP
jgi:hypothetical protein